MNILIVKLSAIGDVIHTLPALAALRRLYPDADITWVVEEAAADLLADHPDLNRVIVSRRKTWLSGLRRGLIIKSLGEMRAFLRELRSRRYDLVIDFHGLLKSAVIVFLSGGKRKLGYASLQEGSGLFYNEKIPEDLGRHAVDRYLDFVRYLAAGRDDRGATCLAAAPEFTIAVGEEERRHVEALLDEHSGIMTTGESGGENDGSGGERAVERSFWKDVNQPLEARKEALGEEAGLSSSAVEGERPQRQGSGNEARVSNFQQSGEVRGRTLAMDGERSDFGRLDFVAVNPVAFWETKLWGDEKFAELCDRIRTELGIGVVLTGGKAEPLERIRAKMKTGAVNLGGKTSLRELACLYRQAALVVSTDSGPMHLAAGGGTPVVALFGPTDPTRTGPYGPGHRVIRGDLSCSPCFRKHCEDPRCMKGIGVEEVFTAVKDTLGK
ncbi:MAG: glycosyltransferase family 9 protein [Proteobacteria bacterium]|nr:glycosyltransferase family 9 protein [Pseudomonadota bacterium]MBU2226831.1 glycosyltransferase family 9 protein [Pseudomonadota bacterium]MBU2262096.1 glycosyltransferase family 9 protein [Pseudomonadota bacterium]